MAGAIAAITIAMWYYQSALKTNKNPIISAGVGLLVYFIPAILWTFLVTPGLRDSVEHNPELFLGLMVRYGYIVIGVICAVWVKPRYLANIE